MKKVYAFDKKDYTVEVNKKSNRTSQKKSSKEVKSPSSKPTTSDSDRAYFKSKKARLPKEQEEESEKETFIKKYGEVLEI